MTTKCSQQSDNDPSLPIDRVEVKDTVYFYLDGLSTDDISDATLDKIIEKCIGKFEDSAVYQCDVNYCALMSTLQHLIRKSWVDNGDESVGAIKRQRDKEGNVEQEIEWHSSTGSVETGWEKLYDFFLANPADICECLEEERGNTFGLISIGGTKQDRYTEVNYDSNTRTLWDTNSIGNKFSYRREQSRRRSNNRSKYWSKR